MLVDWVWIEMSTSAQAEECQQLMDTPGSGSVTELAREDDSPYKDGMSAGGTFLHGRDFGEPLPGMFNFSRLTRYHLKSLGSS